MTTTIFWINEPKIGNNKLGMMARPRGNDWLEDEIAGLKKKKVDCVVSLLEKSEVWELGLQNEALLCKKQGIEYLNFPIKDVSTPDNKNEFIRLAVGLANRIQQNQRLIIHCRMGIGRTSVLTAAIMIKFGYEAKNIFEIIGEYRKLNVPDTQDQKDWLLSIEEKIS